MTDETVVRDLQAMLDELIDVVMGVKQAHYVVPGRDPLHAELDSLFDDLRTWTGELAERSSEVGGSLGGVTTVAGHHAKTMFARDRDDRTIAAVLEGPLRQAEAHARSYMTDVAGRDDRAGALFGEVADGLGNHVARLRDVAGP